MFNVISFIRNYSHIFIIGLFCVALWGLNARNSQLTATNDRLEQLTNSKDEQINSLRAKNDDLASSVTELTNAVKQQNEVMKDVTEQRSEATQQNRKLQDEIRRYLSTDKCSVAPVNHDAVNRLRKAAESAGGVSASEGGKTPDPR
jgi:chromosome segregation ATPase